MQPDKRTLKRKVDVTADQGTSSDSTSTDHDIGGSSPASRSSADHEEIGDSEETDKSGDTESVEESDENKGMHYTKKTFAPPNVMKLFSRSVHIQGVSEGYNIILH